MNRKLSNILLLTLLIGFFHSNGQSYNFKTYTVRDGVPHSVIWGIFEDSRGYIWLSTFGRGVGRFDGTNFENFTMIDGLPSNIINDAVEDTDGNMWFATAESGASFFNGKTFINYTIEDGLIDNAIISLLKDSKNRIWLGTEKGLSIYEDGNFSSYGIEDGLAGEYVNYFFEDRQGKVWIATNRGVSVSENGIINEFSGLSDIKYGISQIREGLDGSMYFSSLGDGFYKIKGQEISHFTKLDGMLENSINAITIDEDGALWIGSDIGLSYYDGNSFKNYTEKEGLPSGSILNLSHDHFGNLWISVNEVGLVKYQKNGFEYFTTKNDLLSDNIYSIFQIDSASFWVGSDKGLSLMRGNEVTNFNRNSGFPADQVYHIHQSKNGDFWFSTGTGIVIYDFKTFEKAESFGINHITEGKNDNKWLSFGAGIIELLKQGTPPKYADREFFHHLERTGFTNNYTGPAIIDASGSLWISTLGAGLYKYENREFKHYKVEDGLPSNYINTIVLDANDQLWIGTSNGISHFDGTTFHNFTEADGLNSNKANNLIFENDSVLWVGLTQGVDRLTLNKKNEVVHLKNYGFDEGFIGIETNSNAGIKDLEGNIWFGTIDGLTKITPSELVKDATEAFIHITDVKLFFEEVDWTVFCDSFTSWFALPSHLILSHDNNHLTFDFIGIDHISPLKISYKWKLEGFDDDWSRTSNQTQITYSNIPPGTYSFKVKAQNGEGVWNKTPATFDFKISAPYWQKWWFWIIISLLIIGLFFIGLRWRVNQIKKSEHIKRRMVEMELKALRAQMNPHFTFNTMNSIQHFIKKNEKESAIRYISKFSKLLRMILDNSSVEMITIERELQALTIYLEIESLRFEEKFDYQIKIDPNLDESFDKIPSMVLQPYIENAIWHGLMNKKGRGKITIEILKVEKGIVCIIEDNGVGREAALIQKSKFQTDQKSFGMLISDERLKLLNQSQYQDLNVKVVDLKDDTGKASGTRVEVFISAE